MFGGDPKPIKLTPEERTEADTVYDHWGASIYFQKEFFHNGYIKNLAGTFLNTRDTSFAYPVTSGQRPPGTIERVTCWPMK